jgi:hypothetical protein
MTTYAPLKHPLSPSQTLVLDAALARRDLAIWPLPTQLPAKGGALLRVLAALLKAGLVEEVPAGGGDHVWKRDEDGGELTLRASALARIARGLPEPSAAPVSDSDDAAAAITGTPRGKLGIVITALSSESGATLEALVALTGWLPHTARAALTRLRQRGHAIIRERDAGHSVYRIASPGVAVPMVLLTAGIADHGA